MQITKRDLEELSPEYYQRYLSGEFPSVRKAAIAAGIRIPFRESAARILQNKYPAVWERYLAGEFASVSAAYQFAKGAIVVRTISVTSRTPMTTIARNLRAALSDRQIHELVALLNPPPDHVAA